MKSLWYGNLDVRNFFYFSWGILFIYYSSLQLKVLDYEGFFPFKLLTLDFYYFFISYYFGSSWFVLFWECFSSIFYRPKDEGILNLLFLFLSFSLLVYFIIGAHFLLWNWWMLTNVIFFKHAKFLISYIS